MLDKKQIQAIFIPEFKIGHKVVETTCQHQQWFSPGTANKSTVLQEVLQNRWEPWRWGAQCPAFGSYQRPIDRIIEADPLTSTREVAKNSVSTILRSFSIWSKLERWKSSVSGCLMSRPNLLFCATINHFAVGLWCAMKRGFYMTISEDQFSGWTKKKRQSTSQSQTCTKKGPSQW